MKNGLKVAIIFILTALLIYGTMTMMFQIKSAALTRLYRENLFGNIAFEVRQYVKQIESGLMYGKELDNYFGIDKLLGKCYTSSSYLRGVFVFDREGKLLYNMGVKEGSIPNASAVPLNGATYAVRTWQQAEYIIMDILDEQGISAGRLMISLDAAVLANTIEEQEQIALWQSLCIAAEGILLCSILLIRRLKKNTKPIRVFKAVLLIVCCTLLPVCADAFVQDIRFARVVEASTEHSVQRVSQMLQQQVDTMAGLGVSPNMYDINGYLQQLQESVENVAALRLSESGAILAEPSEVYISAFTGDYRAKALQYILILFASGAFLLAITALFQYAMNRRQHMKENQGTALQHSPRGVAEKAREALMKNPLQNTMLLACLNDGFADEIHVLRDGNVCLHDRVSGLYLFSAGDEEAFRTLYQRVNGNAKTLFVNKGSLLPGIEGFLGVCSIHKYTQWTLQDNVALHIADIEGMQFIRLNETHIPWVLENYHSTEFGSDNVRERILTQNSVGAVLNGSLIGIILSHYNGEIGPIVVLPSYRKLGIGENLMVRISSLQREQGRPCFSFVDAENIASKSMCARIGYSQTPEDTLWIYRD